MYDATSRKDIRRAEKDLAAAAEASARFVRTAMSTASGRKWFHTLLASCGVFTIDPVFEPNRDYFFLGIRNVGMRIFAELQTACPDLYILMENEAIVSRPHLTWFLNLQSSKIKEKSAVFASMTF